MKGPAVLSRSTALRGTIALALLVVAWSTTIAAADDPAASPSANGANPAAAPAGKSAGSGKSPASPSGKPAAKPAAKSPAKADGKSDAKSEAAKAEAAEFKAARPEIQRQMRSKATETRAAGVRRLQGYPLVEAAKLAMNAGLNDEAREVREAAYETLLKFSGNEEICNYFLDYLNRSARKGDLNERAVPMLAALLASPVDEVDLGTRELLDVVLDKSKKGELLVTELADELGNRDAEDSVPPLVKLSKSQMFVDHFGVRRAVVDALIRLDRLSAVDELIRFLVDVQGEARADILKYLTAITGQNFLNDSKAWAIWWRQNKDAFVLPPLNARAALQIATPETAYYYGLPIYAQKMVFVMDTSGSMAEFNRIGAAKRELCDAINNLSENSQFAIVIFNSNVDVWQRRLMPATAANKKAAAYYVQSQAPRLSTASYDALEAAFAFDAEAIFFLSDGDPTSGKYVVPAEIVQVITTGNRSRRESIYTIGLAPGLPESPLEWFMRALAQQNAGTYRRVDQ